MDFGQSVLSYAFKKKDRACRGANISRGVF